MFSYCYELVFLSSLLACICPETTSLNNGDDVYKQNNEHTINKKGDPFEVAFVVFRFPFQRNIS